VVSLLDEFRTIPEFRKCAQRKFVVGEVLFVSILAILAGANGYEEIEAWIKSKKQKIAKFLGKPFIAPADNTIRAFFLGVDVLALESILSKWSQKSMVQNIKKLKVVAADGKSLTGSRNTIMETRARHIVSLFLADEQLVLAQCEVDEKSNEIPALLNLLESLELTGCIITADAMHTQKNIGGYYQKAA
jgi:uncharacterized protein YacL (UPF0231 family)